MIRRAKYEDIHAIMTMARLYFPTFKNKNIELNEKAFMAYVLDFLEPSQARASFVSEKEGRVVGVVFVFMSMQPFTGRIIAIKSIWGAISPGHGRRLLRKAEIWAIDKGAHSINVACFDERTEKLLGRVGYSETEKSFEKVLNK